VTNQISTGCPCLDKKINGGISPENIIMIYGEPETGKTTLTMQCAIDAAKKNLKTLFIDCDNTFSPERLNQISKSDFNQIAQMIILVRPTDFAQQTTLIDHLPDYIEKNFGLVVIDTFNSLYRAKIAETTPKTSFTINRELNRQMATLAQTARTKRLPIIVTSQVRGVFDDKYITVAPVATRVLQFWADTIISLKPTENQQVIQATSEKNQNTQEATCYLRITGTGLKDY
jgi:RecA/RadA recombinase